MLLFIFGLILLNGVEAFKLESQKIEKFDIKKTIGLPIYNVDPGNPHISNFRYTIPISIGKPAQDFKVYLNMQSGDTFVAHKACKSLSNGCTEFCRAGCNRFGCDGCCSATYFDCLINDKYDNSASSTFKNLSSTWKPQNEYDGFYGQETVSFGSAEDLDVVEIPNSNVEFATFVTNGIVDGNFSDGSFGLGFSKLATDGKTPVWENSFKQNIFSQSLFTIMLEKNASTKQGEYAGQINFGTLDSCKIETIKYFDLINDQGYWGFPINKTLFNGNTLTDGRPHKVVVELNERFILVPDAEFRQIVKETKAIWDFDYEAFTVDCDSSFKWSFDLDGKTIELDSKDFLVREQGGKCVLPFDAQWNPLLDYVLGKPFMKLYCGVFDYGKSKVGFGVPYYNL